MPRVTIGFAALALTLVVPFTAQAQDNTLLTSTQNRVSWEFGQDIYTGGRAGELGMYFGVSQGSNRSDVSVHRACTDACAHHADRARIAGTRFFVRGQQRSAAGLTRCERDRDVTASSSPHMPVGSRAQRSSSVERKPNRASASSSISSRSQLKAEDP